MNRRQFFGISAAATAIPAFAAAADLQKQIRITSLETDILRFPAEKIYYDAIHTMGGAHEGLVLRLHTSAGITGWASSSLALIPGAGAALQQIVQNALRPVLTGQDPHLSQASPSRYVEGP